MDERLSKREPVRRGCWLVDESGCSCVHTFDISAGGIRVSADDLRAVGKRVNLHYYTHSSARPVIAEAEVVWCHEDQDGCSMGLKFMSGGGEGAELVRLLMQCRK